MKAVSKTEVVLILVDIRSAHNVGSIFRPADAAGISKIYLVGYTPAPLDRFGRIVKEIAKTALGAEKSVEWKKVSEIEELFKNLKAKDFRIMALEQAANSVDYKKVKIKESSAIILGNEVGGLSAEILNQCDIVAEIPMRGQKESLNVAVAAGIFLFRLLDN